MTDSLQVIALISGGKDSFFSLLHCVQNGHKVVALGNLHPVAGKPGSNTVDGSNHGPENADDEHDLNSFMYQTVGHTVVPLYQQALGIPLYRQPIVGTAVQTGTSYGQPCVGAVELSTSDLGPAGDGESRQSGEEDETESLVPLLERILADHPGANALSTGAILSTYQRTRVESVALRLGLIPLAYLWKYPVLPPGIQSSLLEDMHAVGLDARIVKVASGGLDESYLWENVAIHQVMGRIERSMKRFGTYGDGAVLGEGGEFETLVVDGPSSLFKGRIEVQDRDKRVVREGGGSSWLRILDAKVVMKNSAQDVKTRCRVPDQLEPRFNNILNALMSNSEGGGFPMLDSLKTSLSQGSKNQQVVSSKCLVTRNTILHWNVTADEQSTTRSITDEAGDLMEEIRIRLHKSSLKPTNIISTIIVLRSMEDFASVNKVYGALFASPNPPARVTVACGNLLPKHVNISIHLKIHIQPPSSPERKALHVQSRSYWAPANIGPYSQAISIPLPPLNDEHPPVWAVSVAGQIPLIPHTMSLPISKNDNETLNPRGYDDSNFKLQTLLALQHLWRIGQEMGVQWWTSAVAYLPRSSLEAVAEKAAIVSRAWILAHQSNLDDSESEDEETRDLWEEKHYAGMEIRGAEKVEKLLPDWAVVKYDDGERVRFPPFWVVEVEELPRGSGVEWHAQLGVVGGPVKLSSRHGEDGWSIHRCSFGGTVQSVVILAYSDDVPALRRRLGEAVKVLDADLTTTERIHASYLDVSIKGMLDLQTFGGRIPCQSIWGTFGDRLAAVLILDML